MQGTIIAVVGAPASGKSFLSQRLQAHFKATAFFEGGPDTLPKRIIQNLAKQVRN